MTSPLTWSADSIPKNANIKSNPASPTARSGGNVVIARLAVCTWDRPSRTKATSGSSLASVEMPLTREPSAVPRMLTQARIAKIAASSNDRATLPGEDRDETGECISEHGSDGGHCERYAEPKQDAADEPDIGAERYLDIGIRSPL